MNTTTRISRYSNNLRNLLPSNDVSVMELAAKTLVKLALLPGSKGAESFEFDIKRAFEWLSEERNEVRNFNFSYARSSTHLEYFQGKRHAAVLVLRELAVAMPTYFYQQVSGFFEHIFNAIRDPKPIIRDGAGQALRAALVVTSQRESAKQSNKPQIQWYKQCYEEAIVCFGEVPIKEKGVTKDDRIHGALIVLDELFRCANVVWERRYSSLRFLEQEPKKPMYEDFTTILPRFKAPFIEKLHSHQQVQTTSSLYDIESSKCLSNLSESAVCRQILLDNYEDICAKVLDQRISKSSHVQQTLYSILPRLAALSKEVFVKNYLKTTVNFLLATLKGKEKDRNMAFVTLGFLAVAVENDIKKFLPSIVEIIKSTLPPKDAVKRKTTVDPSVFMCITLLGHAVKSGISQEITDTLESMISTGLSPALTICFRELAENVPVVRRQISDGLLKMLSQVLINSGPNQDVQTIVLALKTLGTFNFDGQSLLEFVQRCSDYFVASEQQEIRLEAVQTCSRLLKIALQTDVNDESVVSATLKETIAHVLERLLVVGITDVDPNVRLRVLRSLDDSSFDDHLAQPESLCALLVTLNDEVFEIRELAIITIGRLTSINPAYVMPSMRKTLVNLLTELEHSGMSRNKEQSARMLDHLIVNTPRLISSYMRPILTILVPKLKEAESNPGVILNVLRAIGDLAEVNGGSNEMERWADELLEILLEMLADAGSPDKRGVALWTLGQLVSATGRAVSPYHKYPFLIDILINFLKTEQQRSIRRETIRVLGLLGALGKYLVLQTSLNNYENSIFRSI